MDQKSNRSLGPALTLFFLAPVVGELLSGSAPPVEFFSPLTLILLAALYGSGAILVRELRVRWRKGWPTVLVLGAAYGMVEEGLMVKSFFDPNWMDLGLLGTYGRWAGVNWVWSLELTLYHAVFSIGIPILLVELIFPAQRGQSWVGRRGMRFLTILLAFVVLLGFLALTTYRPPIIPYLLTAMGVVVLYFIAPRLPLPKPSEQMGPVARPRTFALIGFAATVAFFLIHWVLPELALPVPLTMAAAVVLVACLLWAISRLSRGGRWADPQRLALSGGALTFFVLLAPLAELDPERLDNPAGMTVVGLVTLSFLAWLWRRCKQ